MKKNGIVFTYLDEFCNVYTYIKSAIRSISKFVCFYQIQKYSLTENQEEK
jgi:hypothetical protein